MKLGCINHSGGEVTMTTTTFLVWSLQDKNNYNIILYVCVFVCLCVYVCMCVSVFVCVSEKVCIVVICKCMCIVCASGLVIVCVRLCLCTYVL